MRRARIFSWFQEAGATALTGPWQLIRERNRTATRTGGPDDDDDDDEDALLRKLMPILACVIVVAVVFGG